MKRNKTVVDMLLTVSRADSIKLHIKVTSIQGQNLYALLLLTYGTIYVTTRLPTLVCKAFTDIGKNHISSANAASKKTGCQQKQPRDQIVNQLNAPRSKRHSSPLNE